MKGSTILLDHLAGRRAAARMMDGRLEDLLVDPLPEQGPLPETIYRGKVDRLIKGQGGVFVRLPEGARGFLRQTSGIAPGQDLLVQVTGHAEAGKAVPLTARVLFKSRFVIVTPGAPGLNVSRQIRDSGRRDALQTLAIAADPPEGTGLILRSEAAEAQDDAISDDLTETLALARRIMGDLTGPPELLLDGPDAHVTAWRDWGLADEIDDDGGCFAERGVLDELTSVLGLESPLPGGGSLVVEPTRALVAVDVNTGGDTTPAAALKVNIAAARALPRLLRLKGLGGQIVVDFAPLAKKDRGTIEQVLKAAFRADLVETSLAGWTPLGLFEMQRKRERVPLDPTLLKSL